LAVLYLVNTVSVQLIGGKTHAVSEATSIFRGQAGH